MPSKVCPFALLSLDGPACKPDDSKVVTEFENFVSAMSAQPRQAPSHTILTSDSSSDEENPYRPIEQPGQPLSTRAEQSLVPVMPCCALSHG